MKLSIMDTQIQTINQITHEIIGASIEVHRHLGPGLLESAHEECALFEMRARGLRVETQRVVPVVYKGIAIEAAYRIDILVNGCIVVEVKAVERLTPLHDAQILTYMRLLQCPVGLLVNFNVAQLIQGVRRMTLEPVAAEIQSPKKSGHPKMPALIFKTTRAD